MSGEAVAASPASGESSLGERVRGARLARSISVRALASKAGFSPSFLSQVELGQVSPSLASLERIASALGVTLGDLFSQASSRPISILRAAERQSLVSSWSRAQIELLGPAGADRTLEPAMITIDPGGHSGKFVRARAGEQFAIVLEGRVTLTLGDEVFVLDQGDSVTFPLEASHHWENTGLAMARILTVSSRSA